MRDANGTGDGASGLLGASDHAGQAGDPREVAVHAMRLRGVAANLDKLHPIERLIYEDLLTRKTWCEACPTILEQLWKKATQR